MSETPVPTPTPPTDTGKLVDASLKEIFGPLVTFGGRSTLLVGAAGWTCLTLAATSEIPVAAHLLFIFGKVAVITAGFALCGWLLGAQAAGCFDGKLASVRAVLFGSLSLGRRAKYVLAVLLMLVPTAALLLVAPAAFLYIAAGAGNGMQDAMVCEKAIIADYRTGKPAGFDVDGMCARAGYPIEVRPWCDAAPDTCTPSP